MRQPSRRFLFWGLYAGFLLLLAEGTARLVFAVPALNGRIDAWDNLAWRRRWVTNHQAGRPMLFSFDAYDSTKGYKPQANIRNKKVFKNKILNTNAEAFRGDRDFTLKKDSSKTRILLLGDSFTFGQDVSDDETYAQVLQRALPNAEVLNAGVQGYAHDQMLAMLREQLRFQPDIVMLGYLPADLSRNLLSFRDYAKPWYTLEANGLQLHGTPVPRPEEILRMDWARPRLLNLMTAIQYRLEKPASRDARAEVLSSAILHEIVRVADSARATPIFVYLPEGKELVARRDSGHKEIWFSQLCRTMSSLRCFSAMSAFQVPLDSGVTFKSGHWDATGHRVAGEGIARFLTESGLLRASTSSSTIAESSDRARLPDLH